MRRDSAVRPFCTARLDADAHHAMPWRDGSMRELPCDRRSPAAGDRRTPDSPPDGTAARGPAEPAVLGASRAHRDGCLDPIHAPSMPCPSSPSAHPRGARCQQVVAKHAVRAAGATSRYCPLMRTVRPHGGMRSPQPNPVCPHGLQSANNSSPPTPLIGKRVTSEPSGFMT